MQTATCALCQERVNLLAQKLVSVQWVEPKSGALLALQFHSDCYVRWYRETARASQPESRARAAPLTTSPPKPQALLPNADSPEKHLSSDEIQRLARLRGRSDRDSGSARREVHAEDHLNQPDQPDEQSPQKHQPEDSHDIAPPDV